MIGAKSARRLNDSESIRNRKSTARNLRELAGIDRLEKMILRPGKFAWNGGTKSCRQGPPAVPNRGVAAANRARSREDAALSLRVEAHFACRDSSGAPTMMA
jgi:hypothetical protein